MGRHAYHRHAFKAVHPDETRGADSDYLRGIAYCGETHYFKPAERETGAGKRATCPRCAAALGKLNLLRYGGRVRLEPASGEVAKRFKSAWRFYLDGEERGLIATERGFGKGWDLYALPTARELGYRSHGSSVTPGRPSSWDAERVSPEQPIQPLHYGARDAMACGAVRAVAAGMLPTAAERAEAERIAADRKAEQEREREAERATNLAALERLRAEHGEQVETATLGLADLAQRPDLTNLERAGIEAALVLVRRSQPA